MDKMNPVKYEVQLIYKCPECEAEHYSTIEETVFPAGILCYCGYKLKLKRIDDTRLILNPKNSSKPSKTSEARGTFRTEEEPAEESGKKEHDTIVEKAFYNDLVKSLVKMGYQKSQAKKRALSAIEKHSNLEDCIKYALSY